MTTGPIKLPPQSIDRTPAHDQPLDHTYSNPFSSRRSSRGTVNNPTPAISNSNDSARPLFTPPRTPNDRNILEQASLSQPHSRSPFDLFSSGSSGITSYPGQSARMSAGAVSSATSQAASLPRPLPIPSHSPPPYSSKHASLRHSGQNKSPLSSVFPGDEKRHSLFKNDGISQAGQPKTCDGEYPVQYTVPSTDDRVDAGPFGDPPITTVSNTPAVPARAPRDSMMSLTSAEIQHGNAPPSSWRSTLSPFPPRPTSIVSDPFNNKGFELPGWLDSDPHSRAGEGARATATASIYSAAQRSVAASSKILPSDTSLRTLSPEPSEDNHGATLHVAVLTRFRTISMGHGTEESAIAVPGESVEGDGPESFAVQLSSGAERKGWGREDLQRQSQHESQRIIPSGSGALELDHFSPEAASLTPPPSSPGVPLSAEFEARGLGRSFIQSLLSKVRWPSTTVNDNSHRLGVPQEATRGPEGVPTWLREDPFEIPRASMGAASSKLLPSEAGHGDASSIRSNQAEVGWIEPQLESTNRQSLVKAIPEPVNGPGVVDTSLSAVNQEPGLSVAPDAQESQSRSQPRTPPPPPPVPPPVPPS